ncbi:Frataxin-like domain-containing protein [Aspergillus unguis]
MLSRHTSRALLSSAPRLGRVVAAVPSASTRFPSSKPVAQRSPRYQGFHSTPAIRKGISPGSSDPPAPNPEPSSPAKAATPLTDHQYYEYSEKYLHLVQAKVEELEESGSDMESDYQTGILSIRMANAGTYILNKQPPLKQLWLSSPVSGPRQYDWVVEGDQMHEKQDSRPFANGQWVCLRDESNLTELLNKELNLGLPKDVYSEAEE